MLNQMALSRGTSRKSGCWPVNRRKSSHNPGCIRALPASQSCQVRRVEWMSLAADVCESPAASRAVTISDGAGLEAGPFGPRFGWLGMLGKVLCRSVALGTAISESVAGFAHGVAIDAFEERSNLFFIKNGTGLLQEGFDSITFSPHGKNRVADGPGKYAVTGGQDVALVGGGAQQRSGGGKRFSEIKGGLHGGAKFGHFDLLAPVPEARRMRCIHELNSTRNPCICKDYFQ